MRYYYSPSRRGFYVSEDIDRDYPDLPNDLIEIDRDTWKSLLNGQSQGKVISFNKGNLGLKDQPLPTSEQLVAITQKEVNNILKNTAWRVAEDEPNRMVWVEYRSQVRSLIGQENPTFPEEPQE